jgi:hypothetical protein
MPAKQYMAISRQTARNAMNGSPTYQFYKIKGKLEPDLDVKEEVVREWAGQDTAQGDATHDRTSTAWKYGMEARVFPSVELALLLEFLFGYKSAPSVVDATANKVMFKTISEMFDVAAPLVDNAIALLPHTDKAGTTYHQKFIGGRIKGGELNFKGGEDVNMKLDFIGGPWISAPEQAEVAGMSFPASRRFKSGNLTCFLGTGATLTGTAPDYTDIAPGSMPQFKPDDMTVKFEPGIDDKFKMNGEDGPSVTERTGSWKITAEWTIDFSDPASGWSSYDAWFARFSAIQYAALMLKVDSGEVAGSTTQTRQLLLYVPKGKISNDAVDRKNDGSKTKIKFKYESLVDLTVNACAVAKLVY